MQNTLFKSVAIGALVIGLFGCSSNKGKPDANGMTNATPTVTENKMATAESDWDDAQAVAIEAADFAQSSTNMVQDQMNAVCQKLRKKGRIISTGSAPVAGGANRDDFIDARNIAFERALVDAQIKTIQAMSNDIRTETTAAMFMPGLAPESASPEAAIKAAAQNPDSIDPAKLTSLGIDPPQFKAATPAVRQEILTNSINKSATSLAVGSLVGLSVLHSFEGSDGKGGFAVGVCTVTSQKLKNFASQILSAKGNIEPQKSRAMDLNKLIIAKTTTPEGKAQLSAQFGVLRLFDENGSPALVSFYQAGVKGKSAAVQSQMAEIAKRNATGFADASLAQFLAGSATFASTQGVEEIVETIISGDSEEQKITRALSIQQKFNAQAAVRLSGVTDLVQWNGKHPLTGKDIVGVIRIWTADSEFTMRAFQDNAVGAGGAGKTGLLPSATKPTVTQSKTTMDSQDF